MLKPGAGRRFVMSDEIEAVDIKELLEETIKDAANTARDNVAVEGTEL